MIHPITGNYSAARTQKVHKKVTNEAKKQPLSANRAFLVFSLYVLPLSPRSPLPPPRPMSLKQYGNARGESCMHMTCVHNFFTCRGCSICHGHCHIWPSWLPRGAHWLELWFESRQERRQNFLLQGQLSVLILISVSVPSPCYRSSA